MAIIIDGTTTIKYLTVDTSNVMKKGYVDNSILVYSADEEIYKDGVIKGATVSGDFIQDSDKLRLTSGLPNYWATNPETGERYIVHTTDTKTGRITLNVSDFDHITVKGYFNGWARFANAYVKLGLDSASEQIGSGYPYDPQYFTRTYNVASLTGNHSIVGYSYCNNISGEVGIAPSINLCITEIIAYT